jgi:hypothetical protein
MRREKSWTSFKRAGVGQEYFIDWKLALSLPVMFRRMRSPALFLFMRALFLLHQSASRKVFARAHCTRSLAIIKF